jgi:hypothetical protein
MFVVVIMLLVGANWLESRTATLYRVPKLPTELTRYQAGSRPHTLVCLAGIYQVLIPHLVQRNQRYAYG